MNKHVAAVRLVDRDEATEAVELPEELRLSPGAIASVAREGLLAMCTTVGLAVMGEMMTAEMTAKVGGPKHAKLAQRQGNWHGSAPGSAVLAADPGRSGGHGAAPLRATRSSSPPTPRSVTMTCCRRS